MRMGSAVPFWHLFRYECRKVFGNIWVPIFLALLLLSNGWRIQEEYSRKTQMWEPYTAQYTQCYQAYSGSITGEKVSDLMVRYAPLEEKWNAAMLDGNPSPDAFTYSEFMDEMFFRTLFVTEMKYDYFYQNTAVHISSTARELAAFYRNAGNAFEAAKNEKIAADFSGRVIPAFADTRGYEVLLQHDYSSMVILLLSIFALCRVFVQERESEMYMLLRTARNGFGRTVAAKLFTSAGFIIAACFLFYLQDFLMIYFMGGRNEALSSPVYALRYFAGTPMNMTVAQYFLWAAVAKTFGILCFGCVILLISSIMKQVLPVFFVSLTLMAGGALLQEISRTYYAFKWFNPMELVMVRKLLIDESFVNFFGFAVPLLRFVAVGLAITIGVLIALILVCNRGYHNQGRRRKCFAEK